MMAIDERRSTPLCIHFGFFKKIAFGLGLVGLSVSPSAADFCGNLIQSSLNPIAYQQQRIVQTIKTTGNCAQLPTLHRLERKYGIVCRSLATRYVRQCRITCTPQIKSDAEVEAEMRAYCRKSAPAEDAFKHCRDLNLARTYMGAAQAAVRVAAKESNYNNWSIAEDRFRDAAAIFKCRGRTAEANSATAKADKVKQIYSKLSDHSDRRAPRRTPGLGNAASKKKEPASCGAARRHLLRLKTKGKADSADLENLRSKLKELGCS